MKTEKEAQQEKLAKEQLNKASKERMGESVPFVTMTETPRLSDIYLKHTCNESSEDEEGEEDKIKEGEDEIKEEESFRSFLERHKEEKNKRRKDLKE